MLHAGRFTFSLHRPLIMGIVNVTPDSFSDGGQYFSSQHAIAHGLQLIEEGADLLDIGGESTRPGAAPVTEQEELGRVLPVIEGLHASRVPLSVDTQKPNVMRAAITMGADMINDVNALLAPEAMAAVASTSVAVCLMHKQGEPQHMQQAPQYVHVVNEVRDFLQARVQAAITAGIEANRIVIDPGFGFGKNLEHNVALLKHIGMLTQMGVPVLAGLSRKSMLGKITGLDVQDRLHASVAAAMLAVLKGARIIRVHDVKATHEALAVLNAVEGWEA